MTKTAISIRPLVRDLMQAAPSRSFTIRALWRIIHADDPEVTEVDVDAALTWHHGQGNVTRTYNHELELDEYSLTARGRK